MSLSKAFHSARGGSDFLGLRQGRSGDTEIVYDNGGAHREVWRVATPDAEPRRIGEALAAAVQELRVIPALHLELKKRAISIESVPV